MDRSKKYMYIGVIILLITIVSSIGTYAYFTWASTDNTNVTLSIGELADVTYTTGPDININNLSPVYNYTDGESTTFTIRDKDTTDSLIYKINIDITSIDDDLKSEDFKYILFKDNKKISEGNFKDATSSSSIVLYEGVLSKSSNSSYILYFYIDGNYENSSNMMNKSLVGKIDVVSSEGVYTIANYITNLYTSATKTTVTNNNITYNYASSVSLMNDRLGGTTTSLDGGNIRYYGASPNNYIYFNCPDYSNQTSDTCELWRIIGVFDGKVKIIRNSIIGEYSWDTSASTVNYGNGVNEWSQADLMKLLNPGYESESVGGSLYYNSGSGTCYSNSKNATTSCDFTSTGIKNDTTRGMIAKGVTWNTGGWNSDSVYLNAMYGYERGNALISSPNDGITRNSTWTNVNQTIALAYPSDYGYATDFNSCSKALYYYNDSTCTSANWMKSILGTSSTSSNGCFLTPCSAREYGVWSVFSSGYVTNYYTTDRACEVAPVLYLDSNLSIVDNTLGTIDNPYKLNNT